MPVVLIHSRGDEDYDVHPGGLVAAIETEFGHKVNDADGTQGRKVLMRRGLRSAQQGVSMVRVHNEAEMRDVAVPSAACGW